MLLPADEQRRLVCSLYKRSLKLARDWNYDYSQYRRLALAIRRQFDEHRSEGDEHKATLFIRSVEYLLNRFKHPDPYVFPLDPKGAAFGREVMLPKAFIENGNGHGRLKTLC